MQTNKLAQSRGPLAHKLFEELSAVAAQYLGDSKTSIVFGFLRSDLPRGFRDAVNHLVKQLREGMACTYPSENPYHCGFASPVHTIFATNRSAKNRIIVRIPRILSEGDAENAGTGQILLDRCRNSALCSGVLDDQPEDLLWNWIRTALPENG